MTPILFFLIYISTIWAGTPDSGYTEHYVFISTDLATDCKHVHSRACISDLGFDHSSVIVENPFDWDSRGCNSLTHEWLHLMGYQESELPYCNDLKVPRYMQDYLRNQS